MPPWTRGSKVRTRPVLTYYCPINSTIRIPFCHVIYRVISLQLPMTFIHHCYPYLHYWSTSISLSFQPSPEHSSLFLSCPLLFSHHTSFIPTLITNLLCVPSVWMVIARCDGGSGQLLGQAASSSLDGVRAWICAVILLSSRYRSMSMSLSCMMIRCFVHTNTC